MPITNWDLPDSLQIKFAVVLFNECRDYESHQFFNRNTPNFKFPAGRPFEVWFKLLSDDKYFGWSPNWNPMNELGERKPEGIVLQEFEAMSPVHSALNERMAGLIIRKLVEGGAYDP